ncbi:MAG: hypothetical protein G01um101493_301, partial [Microgenomates group bacterium Gr01-1014_93]
MKVTMVSKSVLVKILINTLVGIGLIFIWLQFVNIKDILNTLKNVEILKIVPVLFFLFLSAVIRTFRLKIFLGSIKKIPLLDLIFLNGVATILNFFITIRGGEVAKGVYLHTEYGMPLGKALVWIFLDRFFDFLVVLGLSAILLLLIPTALSINIIIVITAIFTVGLFVTYLIVYKKDLAEKLFKFLSNLLIVNSIKIYFERIYKFF